MTRSYDDLTSHPVIVRAARVGRRLRGLDLLVPVLVAVLMGLPDLLDPGDPGWQVSPDAPTTLVLLVLLVVPLYWRRRRPVAVFCVVLVVFTVHAAFGILLQTDLALLVTVYNLVLRTRLRQLAWASAGIAVALTVAALRVFQDAPPLAALLVMAMVVTGPAALAVAARLRRAQLAVLREHAARLEQERDQRARLATATERNRIAREMHDVVGHNLSVIVTLADGGAYASTTRPEQGTRALHLIASTGRHALADLRHVLGMLRDSEDATELAPQPGLSAVEALCDQIEAAGPLVTYRTSGDLDGWDQGLQLTAYRIVQEAVTNSLRHAGPHTRIDLSLDAGTDGLRIAVRDSGSPGHAATAPGGAGQGLIGMRERAAIYQGSVTAGPQPGGGWLVTTVLHQHAADPTESSVP